MWLTVGQVVAACYIGTMIVEGLVALFDIREAPNEPSQENRGKRHRYEQRPQAEGKPMTFWGGGHYEPG